jgi:hypothetical protein
MLDLSFLFFKVGAGKRSESPCERINNINYFVRLRKKILLQLPAVGYFQRKEKGQPW